MTSISSTDQSSYYGLILNRANQLGNLISLRARHTTERREAMETLCAAIKESGISLNEIQEANDRLITKADNERGHIVNQIKEDSKKILEFIYENFDKGILSDFSKVESIAPNLHNTGFTRNPRTENYDKYKFTLTLPEAKFKISLDFCSNLISLSDDDSSGLGFKINIENIETNSNIASDLQTAIDFVNKHNEGIVTNEAIVLAENNFGLYGTSDYWLNPNMIPYLNIAKKIAEKGNYRELQSILSELKMQSGSSKETANVT